MADSGVNPGDTTRDAAPGAHPKGDATPGKDQQSPPQAEQLEEMLSRVGLQSTVQAQAHPNPGRQAPAPTAKSDEEPMETEHEKSEDLTQGSDGEQGEQGPDIFHAIHPIKEKWLLKREDDIPNEERESIWKHINVTNESDPRYDPEFDPRIPMIRYYKVTYFIPAWICKWYGDVAYRLSVGPPAGGKVAQGAAMMCRQRTRRLDDTSRPPGTGNAQVVKFIPNQCCPIAGCPIGPDTRNPVHQQDYRFGGWKYRSTLGEYSLRIRLCCLLPPVPFCYTVR